MLTIIRSNKFKTDVKKITNKKDTEELKKVIEMLAKNEALPQKYKAHSLIGNYKAIRNAMANQICYSSTNSLSRSFSFTSFARARILHYFDGGEQVLQYATKYAILKQKSSPFTYYERITIFAGSLLSSGREFWWFGWGRELGFALAGLLGAEFRW